MVFIWNTKKQRERKWNKGEYWVRVDKEFKVFHQSNCSRLRRDGAIAAAPWWRTRTADPYKPRLSNSSSWIHGAGTFKSSTPTVAEEAPKSRAPSDGQEMGSPNFSSFLPNPSGFFSFVRFYLIFAFCLEIAHLTIDDIKGMKTLHVSLQAYGAA